MEADDLGALLLQHEVSLPSAHLQKVCSRIETLTSQKAPLARSTTRIYPGLGVQDHGRDAASRHGAGSSSAERHDATTEAAIYRRRARRRRARRPERAGG